MSLRISSVCLTVNSALVSWHGQPFYFVASFEYYKFIMYGMYVGVYEILIVLYHLRLQSLSYAFRFAMIQTYLTLV